MKLSPNQLLFLLPALALLRDNVVVGFSLPTKHTRLTTITSSLQQLYSSSSTKPWHEEFEILREGSLHKDELEPFFQSRPQFIAKRLIHVSRSLFQAKKDWEATQNATQLNRHVSSLGPLAVKVGQTLSQRPDLIGKEAANALKTLQTKNTPFDNREAYNALHHAFDYWDGPLAPNLQYDSAVDINGPPLFDYFSPEPIAAASLGQVYKARHHNGTLVAIKVQRPDAQAILAMDAQCFRLVFAGKQAVENGLESLEELWKSLHATSTGKNLIPGQTERQVRAELSGNSYEASVPGVIDRVAMDIHKELDYRIEAANGQKFRDSLDFLGFVTTPEIYYATNQVLVTEWVPGKHLDDCTQAEGLALTQMAVQACTASMVLSGFVHADPHCGNVLLHEDGRIVFLDFGLMSNVDPQYMEGFARGIQSLLAQDYKSLVEAFVDTEFVAHPIRHRATTSDLWRQDPNYGVDELAHDLKVAMKTTTGGESRFGALATVLNKKISPNWLVFTPPYVILLIRTFLTLEGMAASVDPNFNIYEMAMPSALKRSLSPCTEKGVQVFRNSLLTKENKIQWEHLVELASTTERKPKEEKKEPAADNFQVAKEKAKQAAMSDAFGSLLGSREGRAMRRVIMDLDSVDLMEKLASPDSRFLLKKAAAAHFDQGNNVNKEKQTDVALLSHEEEMKLSPEFARLQQKQLRWKRKVMRVLIKRHVRKCLLQWRGFKKTLWFAIISSKIFLQMWWQKRVVAWWKMRQENKERKPLLAYAAGLFFLSKPLSAKLLKMCTQSYVQKI